MNTRPTNTLLLFGFVTLLCGLTFLSYLMSEGSVWLSDCVTLLLPLVADQMRKDCPLTFTQTARRSIVARVPPFKHSVNVSRDAG